MLKRFCAILIMSIVAGVGGAFVGYIMGSILYDRAQERVHLPMELGLFGTALGAVIGLSIGIGEAVWTEMKEPEVERE